MALASSIKAWQFNWKARYWCPHFPDSHSGICISDLTTQQQQHWLYKYGVVDRQVQVGNSPLLAGDGKPPSLPGG